MRILIDIGHPAHVHLFKYFANEMINKGHEILFTTREKEHEIYLLQAYGFNFKSFGRHYKSMSGKILGLFKYNIQMLNVAIKFNPDIFLSHGSIYAAQVSWLLRKPHIALEDTGNDEQVRLYRPFTKTILTSESFHKDYGFKQIRYKAYHELAYLNRNYFKIDENFREKLGVNKNEKYIILRFVSWEASHDFGQKGISLSDKTILVASLSEFAKVFISSEQPLPLYFKQYKYPLKPETMHQALANANLFIGEGATMASECAVLGTPAIYINPIEAGTIDEQEKYGMIYHFRNSKGIIEKALEIINNSQSGEIYFNRSKELIEGKIDVTSFLVWFIENWQESFKIMKENPDYQYRFK